MLPQIPLSEYLWGEFAENINAYFVFLLNTCHLGRHAYDQKKDLLQSLVGADPHTLQQVEWGLTLTTCNSQINQNEADRMKETLIENFTFLTNRGTPLDLDYARFRISTIAQGAAEGHVFPNGNGQHGGKRYSKKSSRTTIKNKRKRTRTKKNKRFRH